MHQRAIQFQGTVLNKIIFYCIEPHVNTKQEVPLSNLGIPFEPVPLWNPMLIGQLPGDCIAMFVHKHPNNDGNGFTGCQCLTGTLFHAQLARKKSMVCLFNGTYHFVPNTPLLIEVHIIMFLRANVQPPLLNRWLTENACMFMYARVFVCLSVCACLCVWVWQSIYLVEIKMLLW